MKALKIFFASVMLVAIAATSCDYKYITPDTGEPVDPEEPISFTQQVEPIWTSQSCTNCHNGSGLFSLQQGEAYQSLVGNGLLDFENADNSKIVTVPGSGGLHTDYTYVSNQKLIITTWIEQGAEDN
ncbi:hypothetical protein J1N10_05425 [Carboxylicivirga sp. A043]|uniref:hypothetical protein n=1 Tax=Carboxylicivirga litoralis TaxID=2816963 RepID=UPI0021CB53BC|nr:hypothetical protein [Carboxylicivirga sp. A043]MCU4155406.1 hypothetical protein [Carboxylicivirga sp. A043]